MLINLEQTCLDDKARQAKKIQEMLIEEQQSVRAVSSDGSSSNSSNNTNNNNNYGFALKKLSENVSVESTESTGQQTSIQLPEPITEMESNTNNNQHTDSNYSGIQNMQSAERPPQYNSRGEEYENTTSFGPDDYINVSSSNNNKK